MPQAAPTAGGSYNLQQNSNVVVTRAINDTDSQSAIVVANCQNALSNVVPSNYFAYVVLLSSQPAQGGTSLHFMCPCQAAFLVAGPDAAGFRCTTSPALTMGALRKNVKRKHALEIHWHPGCQKHVIGSEAFKKHTDSCSNTSLSEQGSAIAERHWRDLYRKMYPSLAFPHTPYLNFGMWRYPDAPDLDLDRCMRNVGSDDFDFSGLEDLGVESSTNPFYVHNRDT